MFTNIRWVFLFALVLMFCIHGCDTPVNTVLPPDNVSSGTDPGSDTQNQNMGSVESPESEAAFNQNLLPILTARCAFAGCHVANGPLNIDLSSYQTFIAGGDTGPIFIAGDAQSSDIIEEIVSGRMPIGGPPLTNAQIQLFRDWINQQTPATTPVQPPQQPPTGNVSEPEASFNQNLQPILTARCAYSGCHDANGYDGLDFRTYQSFISGDDEGESVFILGNANSSDIVEEMVSGRMPPAGHGPPMTAAQIQLFRDWINQQNRADFPNLRFDDDDDDDDDDHDHDDDDDHDHDDDDDDHDDD